MSVILKKGLPYNAEYASSDFPVLTGDWTGNVSLYTTYPGVATLAKALTLVGNKMLLALTIEEILNLDSGVYSMVSTFTNAVLGVELSALEYATVADVTISDVPMCKLFVTLGKSDNTPAGKETRTLVNTVDGVVLMLGWAGLALSVAHPVADEMTGDLIDTETISITTNAAGYAQIYVIKGLSVVVSCAGFGQSVPVNTTGLDEYDLSSYFIV